MSYRSHNRDARDIFETIREHRRFKENLVIWMGLRASDYRLIDFLRPDVIASTRYGRDTIPLESKLSVVSTEKVTKIRSDSSMSELNPLLPALLRELARHPSDVYIVSYHSTPMLESIVRRFPNLLCPVPIPHFSVSKFFCLQLPHFWHRIWINYFVLGRQQN